MNCPKCSTEMTPVAKHGVTIDACVSCGGIWLDKGELGELMARINQASSSVDQELLRVEPPRIDFRGARFDEGRSHRGDHHDNYDHHDSKHRKRSIWDIFD
jgi:Zn-finger nucleic acid-binding protein